MHEMNQLWLWVFQFIYSVNNQNSTVIRIEAAIKKAATRVTGPCVVYMLTEEQIQVQHDWLTITRAAIEADLRDRNSPL